MAEIWKIALQHKRLTARIAELEAELANHRAKVRRLVEAAKFAVNKNSHLLKMPESSISKLKQAIAEVEREV